MLPSLTHFVHSMRSLALTCSLTSFVRCAHFGAPFARFDDMCSLTSFVRTGHQSSLRSLRSLTTFAPCCRLCSLRSLTSFAPCGRLRSLAHSLRSFAALALMTCAHSLRSFALVIKAPSSRAKGLFCWLVLRAASRICFASLHNTTLARAP